MGYRWEYKFLFFPQNLKAILQIHSKISLYLYHNFTHSKYMFFVQRDKDYGITCSDIS